MKRLITGSKPIDDGNFILSPEELGILELTEPQSARHFQPFIGAHEYIQGKVRFIIHPDSIPLLELRSLTWVRERMAKVRAYRQASESAPTQAIADSPGSFHVTVMPERPFLVIPQVSSERRAYAPIGWLEPPTIPSDKLRLLLDATLTDFALLTSAMHMAWMRAITGRMKSDYMYSVGVVYNTFPLPPTANLPKLDPLAQSILTARAAHPGATLADLYDPDLMPPDLRRAHSDLDRAVDRLYRPAGFTSDRERVEHLFARYEAMVAPLLAKPAKPRKPRVKP